MLCAQLGIRFCILGAVILLEMDSFGNAEVGLPSGTGRHRTLRAIATLLPRPLLMIILDIVMAVRMALMLILGNFFHLQCLQLKDAKF